MSPDVYTAFVDEMEKIAFHKKASVLSDVAMIGRRIANPKTGLREGWKALAPVANQKSIANQGKGALGRTWRGIVGQGEHLSQGRLPLKGTKVRRTVEDLSRSGWTGTGRLTKYVPIGGKSQMALGTAAGVPTVASAAQGRGDQGLGEAVGENVGFGLGGVLTAGTGMAGIPLTIGAAGLAKALGRGADTAARRTAG